MILKLWCYNCDTYYHVEIEEDEEQALIACEKCGGRLVEEVKSEDDEYLFDETSKVKHKVPYKKGGHGRTNRK